jgi:hypothetical protein
MAAGKSDFSWAKPPFDTFSTLGADAPLKAAKSEAFCRVRVGKNRIQPQRLTLADPQIPDTERQQLAQLLEAWANLPTAVKAAIIAIVECSERD